MTKLLVLALVLLPACRLLPGGEGKTREAATPSHALVVAYDGARYTVSSESPDLKLTDLRELGLAYDRRGKVDAAALKAGTFLDLPGASDDDLLFDFAAGAGDTTCRPVNAAGVPFSGKVPVLCASDAAAFKDLRDACKALAADPAAALFDAAKDVCTCPSRTTKELRFADYRGQPNKLTVDCRNKATKAELAVVCKDVHDRLCKGCKVDVETCECPSGVALTYAEFLNDVEHFRAACGGG